MGVAEFRKLRQLEEENRKLKQLVANLSLDKAMLQEVISKKLSSRRRGDSWCYSSASAFVSVNDEPFVLLAMGVLQ